MGAMAKRTGQSEQPVRWGSRTFASDLIRKYMPTREGMSRNKYLRPIAHRFLTPELWRFTRRSVPRGVALGLFSAFIIPLGQIFVAAFLALPTRANVPLAAATTFVTNPLTIPFWLFLANRLGQFMLQIDEATARVASEQLQSDLWQRVVDGFEMAGVTVLGFLVLALVSSTVGYLVSSAIWRVLVARKRAKRLRRMAKRLDRRLDAV